MVTGKTALAASLGAATACGLLAALAASTGHLGSRSDASLGGRKIRGHLPHRRWRPAAAVPPMAVGLTAWAVSGWPAAAPVAAAAAWGVPEVLRATRRTASVDVLEAVATWTEMLHGTLAASAGLGQALLATAELAPAPIRGELSQLARRIRAGGQPRAALLEFAAAVGDPCADRVVCALLLATSARAQRLGDMLAALAVSTREEVALRLRVETSRASVRSGIRTVVLFSLAFAGLLAVTARSYLAPYASPGGQVVLLVVAGLYAAGIWLMVVLARPPAGVRLLGEEEVVR